MIYLKLYSITVLFLECTLQAQSDYELTPRKLNVNQSTTKKSVFNTMLDSIINAFHLVDFAHGPIDDPAEIVDWQFEQAKNGTSKPKIFQNVLATTEHSITVSQTFWNTREDPEFLLEGFFDPNGHHMNKHLVRKGIIRRLFNRASSLSPLRKEWSKSGTTRKYSKLSSPSLFIENIVQARPMKARLVNLQGLIDNFC